MRGLAVGAGFSASSGTVTWYRSELTDATLLFEPFVLPVLPEKHNSTTLR